MSVKGVYGGEGATLSLVLLRSHAKHSLDHELLRWRTGQPTLFNKEKASSNAYAADDIKTVVWER
jgi:hypothetical protein